MPTPNFAFFGTPDRAVWTLDILKQHGYVPSIIVTQPDRPQGRKLVVTASPVKTWALAQKIAILQPEKIDSAFLETFAKLGVDIGIVIAYGKILPKALLEMPKYGMLNIHGSLLPKYRGSSPIETAILSDDRDVGVSIIKMDEIMDHGPIVAEEKISLDAWPLSADELAQKTVTAGAQKLVTILPDYISGTIVPKEQNHAEATFTKKISRDDGCIDLADDGYRNYLKYLAYKGWPETFFFIEKDGKKLRVKIKDAIYKDGRFEIRRVIPEGKSEMDYSKLFVA